MLKPLLKGDPAKPKEEELDVSIERQLASLGQMKDAYSSLKPNEKRLWNGEQSEQETSSSCGSSGG